MNNKYFIITVDTEGDNLWYYKKGDLVRTENALFCPRFQDLCNKYGFKPVWLTNYEMASDDRFVDYIKPKEAAGLCEVGIHVHAWNNPPIYNLNGKYQGNSYLVEYPVEIMEEKFRVCYELITEKFGHAPVSHRSGRWVMNEEYFRILEDFNIKVDCSVTPLVDWSSTPGESVLGGCDYSQFPIHTHYIGKILEVPMTIRNIRKTDIGSWKHKLKTRLLGKTVWLRPAMFSLSDMKQLVKQVSKSSNTDYIELMMHSSELMPGGSPYFKTNESIEHLYLNLEELFFNLRNMRYCGVTLDEYSNFFSV
ncbi:MAG: hypothetical protein IJ413_01020 [Bacteroides sp.]|nr:hypothetical protein [Bacteroides sp.]